MRSEPGIQSVAGATLLDVGSGLAVFPAVMKEMGWLCTALDPDVRGKLRMQQRSLGLRGLPLTLEPWTATVGLT